MRNLKLRFAAVAIGILVAFGVITTDAAALDVPSRPTDVPIVDQTGTFTDQQKAALAQQIADERQKSGNQIAILMIPSLEGASLEAQSLKVAREWGVGTSENNNGVLLFIVKNDKKLRIEVGYGLEGALTDVQAGRIIRDKIAPHFQKTEYYQGVQAGLTSIIASINGEYTAENPSPYSDPGFVMEMISVVLFIGFGILSWLASILGRSKSWWAGGIVGGVAGGAIGLLTASFVTGFVGVGILAILGLLFDRAVSANYKVNASRGSSPSWWAGGGFGGGGGSRGGGGFGGGGFGGGGSSGGW